MKFRKTQYIFFTLMLGFFGYSFHLYLLQILPASSQELNIDDAINGRLVWQKYNCQACHQLYGLGGYLGPDLTNIMSAPNKGADYAKAIVFGGTPQMPAFPMEEREWNQLRAFLIMTNASGTSDPRQYHIQHDGMITTK